MDQFVDVLLPIPLERNFTYTVTREQHQVLRVGMRVAVPFGKSKLYTGLVVGLHSDPPVAYQAKKVFQILDETPLVSKNQLLHWQWIASYYMCTLGEVFRTAVPGIFLLESETRVLKEPEFEGDRELLDENEAVILKALEHQTALKVSEVSTLTERRTVLPILNRLLQKGAIRLQEKLEDDYRPKQARFIRLHPDYQEESALEALLDGLSRAPKQTRVLLQLFQLQRGSDKPIRSREL